MFVNDEFAYAKKNREWNKTFTLLLFAAFNLKIKLEKKSKNFDWKFARIRNKFTKFYRLKFGIETQLWIWAPILLLN